MTVSFNPGVNPDDYAKTYAAQNNMSVEDAKVALKEKYGDPQKPQDVSVWTEAEKDGEAVSAEDQILKLDPNFIAQLYADQQGMTLDEAIADLEGKLGIASDSNITDTIKNFIQSIIGMVKDKGDARPDQGVDPDAYAQQYADENGITLEEAKAELSAKHGDPVKPEEGNNNVQNAQFDQNQDPDFYVRLYAAENNITYEEAKAYFDSTYGAFN